MNPPQDNSQFDSGQGVKAKLASLDGDFNTSPQFGFMGLLAEHEQKERDANEAFNRDNKAKIVASETDTGEKNIPSDPPDWFGPINTSLQTLKGEMSQNLGHLASQIQEMKLSPPASTPVNPYENAPEEIVPVLQRMDAQQRAINATALTAEHNRAREALRAAKGRYKDFEYSDDELETVWRGHVKNDPNRAAGTNWDMYFDQQYNSRSLPKIRSENQDLKSKLEALQSNRNTVQDLQAVPRTNRQSAPAMSAKNLDTSDFSEDLYQRAKNKVQKGRFIGFGRALIEEQAKMLRSSA